MGLMKERIMCIAISLVRLQKLFCFSILELSLALSL